MNLDAGRESFLRFISFLSHFALGSALVHRGRFAEARQEWIEARKLFFVK
jgi:hypothetical protein